MKGSTIARWKEIAFAWDLKLLEAGAEQCSREKHLNGPDTGTRASLPAEELKSYASSEEGQERASVQPLRASLAFVGDENDMIQDPERTRLYMSANHC